MPEHVEEGRSSVPPKRPPVDAGVVHTPTAFGGRSLCHHCDTVGSNCLLHGVLDRAIDAGKCMCQAHKLA